jgi:phage tail tube protein FII
VLFLFRSDDDIRDRYQSSDLRDDTYRRPARVGQHVNTDSGGACMSQAASSSPVKMSAANMVSKQPVDETLLYELERCSYVSQVVEDGKSDVGWGRPKLPYAR